MSEQVQEPTYENVAEPDASEVKIQALVARPFKVDSNELSTNFYWVSKGGFNFQTTVRGNPTTAEIQAHIDTVKTIAHTVVQVGGQPKSVGQQPQVAAQAAPAPAPTNGNAPAPAPVAPVAPTQVAGPLTFVAVKMTVEPKPDGKARVSFFEAGHKFPDLYSTRKAEEWAITLSACGAWTAAHFAVANEFTLTPPHRVTYHLSEKTNKAGKPYKDLDRIDLA